MSTLRRLLLGALCALLLTDLALGRSADESPLEVLRVGHWLEVKGALTGPAEFTASAAELVQPDDEEELVGTVVEDGARLDRVELLGQVVYLTPETEWSGWDPVPLGGLRVKIEGDYNGPRKFVAEKIKARDEGRDRIMARVDELEETAEGLRVRMLNLWVLLPEELPLEHELELSALELSEVSHRLMDELTEDLLAVDEDDLLGDGLYLTPTLKLSGQLELRYTNEAEYDLDNWNDADRRDTNGSTRLRLTWTPSIDFEGLAEVRHNHLVRDDKEDGWSQPHTTRVSQLYGYRRSLFDQRLDLQIGRQDFDDPREWLYDQNLDAVRLITTYPSLRLELSGSTTLSDGSPRDEAATNWIAYASNNDKDRHLAAYLAHRDFSDGFDESYTHVGLRAIGEWLPATESWTDLALVRGDDQGLDVEGWALDLGGVWSPEDLPISLVLGYAFGSGDADTSDGKDGSFRQTGLQDNTGKLGGVTSVHYYGEMLDPELSNLTVLTAGVTVPFGHRTTVSLIFHDYHQVEAKDELFDASIDLDPAGLRRDVGWELDLILGSRRFENWDVEILGGYFEPGDAFTKADPGAVFQFQARYRF